MLFKQTKPQARINQCQFEAAFYPRASFAWTHRFLKGLIDKTGHEVGLGRQALPPGFEMKRFLSPFFAALVCASMVWASAPNNTTVQGICVLSRNQAEQHRPVLFDATVTYLRPETKSLFVQDGNAGVFVEFENGPKLAPGDRVQIKGTTGWDYRVDVVSNAITVLSHGALPNPEKASFEQLTRGQFDARLVTVHGSIHAADLNSPLGSEPPTAKLKLWTGSGFVEIGVQRGDTQTLQQLLDAEVEVTGVASGKFDGKMQLTGVLLHVGSLDDVKVIKPAAMNPWLLPATPIDEVLGISTVGGETGRVRVDGTITYFEPGSALVLQNGARSLWVKTGSHAPVHIGNWARVIGFPDVDNGFLVLSDGEVQETGISSPIKPYQVRPQDLRTGKHIFDLVSIEGKVVMQARERSEDEYLLLADRQMFSVIYPHRITMGSLSPFKNIPVGSKVSVTGICVTDDANPFGHDVPFNVLLRSADDLLVIAPPSYFTVRNLALIALGLLLAVLAVGARALWVGRKMRTQVAELGYLSQRRSEILEDINRSRPLLEILERITELASMSLKGAPCWCKIGDGPTLGNCPEHLNAAQLRTVEVPIAAHPGNNLGMIFAAFDAHTKPRSDEQKSLVAAAALATLAIETARMHSDLVHRSEFDMLTEVQNRFSFEKRLHKLIDEAHNSAAIFGLIYIDLNDFKQVNDRYGHLAGDLLLQKVAERMKHQLRGCDMLARLGGDEFGVLVHAIHSRGEAENIVRRLESCFDEPFAIKSHIVRGSASIGIALYPTDGVTEDALMSVADSAMYGEKRFKNGIRKAPSGREPQSLASQPHD